MDPDQNAPTGAVCSGSTLFVYGSTLFAYEASTILVDDKKHFMIMRFKG